MDKSEKKHQHLTKDKTKEDRNIHGDEEDQKDGRECEENPKESRKTGPSKGHWRTYQTIRKRKT